MFGFLKKRICDRCGAPFRGNGVTYVRPGTSGPLTLCSTACLEDDVAEQKLLRAARKVACDEADASFRAGLLEAAARGALVGLSLEGERARAIGVLGGPPRGLSAGAWPTAGDEPMLHIATLDLRRLPYQGDACLGVFVQAFRERGSWSLGGELRVLPVASLDLDTALLRPDAKRVPVGILGSRFLYTTAIEPDFRAEASIPSFAGGAPVDFEGRPYQHGRSDEDRFVGQISARLFDVHGADIESLFAEVAGVYVFEKTADLAAYG